MSVSPLAPDVNVNLPFLVLYKILLVQTPLSHGELFARAAYSVPDTSLLSSDLSRFLRVSKSIKAQVNCWFLFQDISLLLAILDRIRAVGEFQDFT